MKYHPILILILVLAISACRELYVPDVISQDQALVVDGLVTNQNESYSVYVSWSVPFDSYKMSIPGTDGKVWVTDDLGNYYLFTDKGEGNYTSDPNDFRGMPGSSYTLHIEINRELYESGPQLLAVVPYERTIYGLVDREEVLETVGSITRRSFENVAKIYLDLKSQGGSLPRFRFDPIQIIESTYEVVDTLEEIIPPPDSKKNNSTGNPFNTSFLKDTPLPATAHFCWRTLYPEDQITTTSKVSSSEESIYEINQQLIGSFPVKRMIMARDTVNIDTIWYNEEILSFVTAVFDTTQSLVHHRFLILNEHQISEDAYQFYAGIKEQSSADGKIFDPLPAQLKGNIKCVSNPDKLAFGLFEVSSQKSSSYQYFPHIGSATVRIEPYEISIPDPEVGNVTGRPPSWWVY